MIVWLRRNCGAGGGTAYNLEMLPPELCIVLVPTIYVKTWLFSMTNAILRCREVYCATCNSFVRHVPQSDRRPEVNGWSPRVLTLMVLIMVERRSPPKLGQGQLTL